MSLHVERRAFTLIETLVVVGIIALLLVIILPAVQSAREAARRGHCLSNLRQIGIALSSYADSYQCFPQAHNGKGYSYIVSMLPFTENKQIYNSINLSLVYPETPHSENSTFANLTLSILLCPADSHPISTGVTNYAGNRGKGYTEVSHANNGVFSHPLYTRPVVYQTITDGTSQTAAVSEWLTGLGPTSIVHAKRSVFATPSAYPRAEQAGEFTHACQNLELSNTTVGLGKGLEWMHGDFISTLYNHAIPPNGHSCTNGSLVQQGAWTVSSEHAGGVNVLFADGHAGFLTDGISNAVWEAIGTSSGGETVNFP